MFTHQSKIATYYNYNYFIRIDYGLFITKLTNEMLLTKPADPIKNWFFKTENIQKMSWL